MSGLKNCDTTADTPNWVFTFANSSNYLVKLTTRVTGPAGRTTSKHGKAGETSLDVLFINVKVSN